MSDPTDSPPTTQPGAAVPRRGVASDVSTSTTSRVSTRSSTRVDFTSSGGISAGQVAGGASGMAFGMNAAFGIEQQQVEALWLETAAKIEASFEIEDTDSVQVEAEHWNKLEGWLLREYTQRLKVLALRVAKLELMIKTYTRSFEARFAAAFRAWSQQFDDRLEAAMRNELNLVVDRKLKVFVSQHAKLVTEIETRVWNEVDVYVQAVISQLKFKLEAELQYYLSRQIEVSIDEVVDVAIRDLWVELEEKVTQILIQTVEVEVDASIRKIDVQVDRDALKLDINSVSRQVMDIELSLAAWARQQIEVLNRWMVDAIVDIKGCTTDRHALTDLLAAFAIQARTRLDSVPCVNPHIWRPVGESRLAAFAYLHSLREAGSWEAAWTERIAGDRGAPLWAGHLHEARLDPQAVPELEAIKGNFGFYLPTALLVEEAGTYELRIRGGRLWVRLGADPDRVELRRGAWVPWIGASAHQVDGVPAVIRGDTGGPEFGAEQVVLRCELGAGRPRLEVHSLYPDALGRPVPTIVEWRAAGEESWKPLRADSALRPTASSWRFGLDVQAP